MIKNHLLEKYLILKIINKYPNKTRYTVKKKIEKLSFPMRVATFYSLIKLMKEEGMLKSEIIQVPYKEQTSTKTGNGWWSRHTKKVEVYCLTSKGYKTLFDLEFRIRTVINLTLYGNKI